MKVLAVKCGINGEESITDKLLKPFLDGLRDENAEVVYINASEFRIEQCRGCTVDSSFQSPGTCLNKDDMLKLYPEFLSSDIWIFASNLGSNGMNNGLINLLDRLEPLFQPYSFTNGTPEQTKSPKGKLALIGTSNEWESDDFEPLIEHFKSMSMLFDREFSGALIRPNVKVLEMLEHVGVNVEEIYDLAKEAGRQLAKKGKIPYELSKKISKELVPKRTIVEELTRLFKEKSQ